MKSITKRAKTFIVIGLCALLAMMVCFVPVKVIKPKAETIPEYELDLELCKEYTSSDTLYGNFHESFTVEKYMDALQQQDASLGKAEYKSLDIQIRIAEIDAELKEMINAISANTVETFDEARAQELAKEKSNLLQQLEQFADIQQKRKNAASRLEKLYTILDGLKNHPLTYDNQLVRQLLEAVIVESKEQIRVIFIGGLEVVQTLET